MSEWYENQKKSISSIRQLLQERIEKVNPRRNLNAEEAKRLTKLETIADKLKLGICVLSNLLPATYLLLNGRFLRFCYIY